MKKTIVTLTFFCFIILKIICLPAAYSDSPDESTKTSSDSLAVLWTSGDSDVAHKVCFMYTHNAKRQKWFDAVRLIVWGPSARNLAGDIKLQEKVKKMMEDGVKVEACVFCAKMYGVVEKLRELGIDVKGMGKPLTKYLKSEWRVLKF
ncbi:DsrE family protein [candidate division KSB1 bacterium]|nr:DsrE family protein [candidate division KSB1 bacterium]